MVCFQVTAQFAFSQRKPALVSTHIKKQNTRAFLVRSRLPFGHRLKIRRFFKTKKEAARYVAYLHAVYKGRIIPNPPLPGGQQYLFQEVSE
jgi:catabolite regulation protein CreA